MTAGLFLLDSGDLASAEVGDLVQLSGAEGRHAVTVRRIAPGERVDVADGEGLLVRGQVADAGRDGLDVRVTAVESLPSPSPRFVLVQALAKGDRDEQASIRVGIVQIMMLLSPSLRDAERVHLDTLTRIYLD